MQKNENEEIKCNNLCLKPFIDQEFYQIFRKNTVRKRKAVRSSGTGLDMCENVQICAKLSPKKFV
jgi:hypothetical protein